MSELKFSEGVFLEKQELGRWQKFIFSDGFKRHLLHNSIGFGLVRNSKLDPNFTWGLVESGTNAETIKVNYLNAIDKDGNIVVKDFEDNISVPNDGNWYWVKASYATSNIEEGAVSIDSSGNLTGVGTKFTEVLRGQPNFPSTISFPDSVSNVLDYEVVEVIDDTNAKLSGITFSAETDIPYRVIGTFTPGEVPSASEKGIFEYDSSTIELVLETAVGEKPGSFVDDVDFALARVTVQLGQVVLEDKRNDLFTTKASNDLSYLSPTTGNPLIGVESIKFDSTTSTRVENAVNVAWGLRTTNWTTNSSLNTITIQSGNGGKYKDTDAFTNGDFDGWRAYLSGSGALLKIVSSVKSGTQINLKLEQMDPELLSDTAQQIIIVPNAEEIELSFIPEDTTTDSVTTIWHFPVNTGLAKIMVPTYADTSPYKLQFRYKNNDSYTELSNIPDDEDNGYYNEGAFDDDGVLITPLNRTTYTNSIITLTRAEDAYSEFKNRVDLGDKLGWINISNLESLAAGLAGRTIPVKVGIDKIRILIEASSTLTGDVYIDLSKEDAKSGNKFEIKTIGAIDENIQYSLIFIQDGDTLDPLLTWSNELRLGDQISRFMFDVDEDSWNVIYENNAFRSYNHFTPRPTIINTSTNSEVANDGKRVLVVEGNNNMVLINDDGAYGEFAYIRFKNQIPINELYIATNTPLITLRNDGIEAEDQGAASGDPNLFAFNPSSNQGTSTGTTFVELSNNKQWIHLVLSKIDNTPDGRQGYYLQSNSDLATIDLDERLTILEDDVTDIENRLVINPEGKNISPNGIPPGTGTPGGWVELPSTLAIPNDGNDYSIVMYGTVIISLTTDASGDPYQCFGRVLFNGSQVSSGEFTSDPTGSTNLNEFVNTFHLSFADDITANGQIISVEVQANRAFGTNSSKIGYLLVPKYD